MSREVRLPSEEWIPLQNLVRDMAESILPIKLDAIKGIECIVGVEWDVDPLFGSTQQLPMEMPIPPSSGLFGPEEHDRGSPQRVLELSPLQDQKEKESLTFSSLFSPLPSRVPCPLDRYRKDLESLLCDLPPLDYPITEEKKSAFLAEFNSHPNRPPMWRPRFLTAKYMEKRYRDHDELIDKLSQYLVAAADRYEEKLIIINSQHQYVPLQVVHGDFANLFIRRDSAIAFVKAVGLAAIVASTQGDPDGIFTKAGKRVWREGKTARWTEDELEALNEFLEIRNPATGKKKYTQALAAKLIGVTAAVVSVQYKAYQERRDGQKYDLSAVGQLLRL